MAKLRITFIGPDLDSNHKPIPDSPDYFHAVDADGGHIKLDLKAAKRLRKEINNWKKWGYLDGHAP